MKTPLDYFYDGYKEWGTNLYGKHFKVFKGYKNGAYHKAMTYSLNYMLGKINEKNATKKITKANAKSKLKDGKQIKSLLKAKKKIS